MSNEREWVEQWAIVELMGHRRLAGRVREANMFGNVLLQLDIPGLEEGIRATQYYSPSALYCLTPCDEASARKAANPYAGGPRQLPAGEHDECSLCGAELELADGGDWLCSNPECANHELF